MREHEEDTQQGVRVYDKATQKAWNMMSMHNSELLLENYELKERLNKMYQVSVFTVIKRKLRNLFRGKYE